MKRLSPIKIAIPEPCGQNWDEMAPLTNGKHCAHCQKNVVDFTGMSDAALLDYVKNNGLGCGRLRDDQLNRIISYHEPKRSYWKQLFLSLCLLLGIQKSAEAQSSDTVTTKPPTEILSVDEMAQWSDRLVPEGNNYSIEGTVSDQKGNLLVSAQIIIYDANKAVIGSSIANFDGFYRITFLASRLFNTKNLTASVKWQNIIEDKSIVIDKVSMVANFRIYTGLMQSRVRYGAMEIRYEKKGVSPLVNFKEPTRRTIQLSRYFQ